MSRLSQPYGSNPFATPSVDTPRLHDRIIRTPSPSPSEQVALSGKKFKITDLLKKENWKLLIAVVFFATFTILLLVYQDQIVKALRPAAKWMHDIKGGWLIPIAILIVLSFPPLMGHEIVIILVGFTWGLGVGFAIACAGTYLGEIATFYTFKYLCLSRAGKIEENNIRYATLARVIREGGVVMAIIARYSTIPGHILTALFASCGMGFVTFTIAVFVALPRQLVTVYFGYALASKDAAGHEPKAENTVKWVSIGIIIATTIAAGRYMEWMEDAIRPDVVYQRRKRRQVKLQEMINNGMLPSLKPVRETSGDSSPAALGALNAPTPMRPSAYPPPQSTYAVGPAAWGTVHPPLRATPLTPSFIDHASNLLQQVWSARVEAVNSRRSQGRMR